MPEQSEIAFHSFADLLPRLVQGRSHLLLGNGFSISCNPLFSYGSLYDAAVAAGLSERARQVFARLGTNNFEGAMRLLDDSDWVARTYGLVGNERSPMLEDLDVIKRTLVEAIANSHLRHTGEVEDNRKERAAAFLNHFHNVFTTNYDLLAYWVNMYASDPPPFEDGFRADPDDPTSASVVFSEHLGNKRGLFFIHGALHLFADASGVRKHSWTRSGRPLTELVREGLDRARYPLFVAEGSADRKVEQIHRNSYLSYCLGKFGRIQKRLVVFGHSLGASDQHIADAIAANHEVTELYVGLYRDPHSDQSRAVRQAVDRIVARRRIHGYRRGSGLQVEYFDSATAECWDAA